MNQIYRNVNNRISIDGSYEIIGVIVYDFFRGIKFRFEIFGRYDI